MLQVIKSVPPGANGTYPAKDMSAPLVVLDAYHRCGAVWAVCTSRVIFNLVKAFL